MNPAWSNFSFPSVATTLTAQGSSAWVVASNGDIYLYYGSSWTLQSSLPTTAPFVGISASTDGSVASVANDSTSFIYAYGGWSSVPTPTGAGIANVAIGDIDNVILVDTFGYKHQILSGILYPHSGSSGPTKLSATLGLTNVWGVSSSGTVYKWTGSAWTVVGGKFLRQVDVSLSISNNLQVVGVDAVGNGWQYDTTTSTWTSISKPLSAAPTDKFIWIEATRGFIWCALSSGEVFRSNL